MTLPNFDYARAAYTDTHAGTAGPIGPDWDSLSYYEQSRFALMYDAGRRDALPALLAQLSEAARREILWPFDQGFIRANAELLGRAMTAERTERDLRAAFRRIAQELAALGKTDGE